ncbi:hypothetical protein [Aromatoleum anaerobium]|uniref:Uncharacterized protein n=1 Tax=Aromatoleum anaerobium TaxID=182180 RepID=A0ABX1PNG3_9RHOO|nr:hypothetical protein [Aromatoleum anaerobium]MCK0507966.1 hypothetical protein [Aromatoleum anaerobium]
MTTPIKLYRPSSGTSGASFIAAWCGHCKRDRVTNGSVRVDDANDDDYCQILGATFRCNTDDPEYPREWRYDEDDYPVCTAFEPADAPEGPSCAVRDEVTADLFGGAA